MDPFFSLLFVFIYPLDLIYNLIIVALFVLISVRFKSKNVFLYTPNLIGYIRIAFVLNASYYLTSNPHYFLQNVFFSSCLDYIDGPVARYLNQTSLFGSFLDIVCDNMARTLMWVGAFHWANDGPLLGGGSNEMPPWLLPLGLYLLCEEWFMLAVTQSQTLVQGSSHWKTRASDEPWIIRQVFKNGFNNPIGNAVIASTYALPYFLCLWFLGYRTWFYTCALIATVPARMLCSFVSMHLFYQFALNLERVEKARTQ